MEHFKALTSNSRSSAIADHMTQTGHRIKWDHLDILATGQSDIHCKIYMVWPWFSCGTVCVCLQCYLIAAMTWYSGFFPPSGGGGNSHMKRGKRGCSSSRLGCRFWSLVSLRVFRAKRQYFMPPRSRLEFREETQNYAKRNRSQIFFLTCFVYRIASVIISLNQRFLQIVENIIIRLISDNLF